MQTGKKKILYVITKSNWGGAQRYVYDLATNLPSETFDVAVVFGGEGELTSKLKEANIRTIPIQRLQRDIGFASDIASFFALLKIFLKEKPDVVHLNSSKAGGLGALATRVYNLLPKGSPLQAISYKLQAKIIFTAHGWAFNEERGAFSKTLIWLLSWLTAFLSHATITVSEYDLSRARQLPFLKKKFVCIHNGIEKGKFLSKKEARAILLPDHATVKDKELWIGMIAELHANKGVEYAIKAAHRYAKKPESEKFILVIIGEGEERAALTKLIQELRLNNGVFLAGKKENAGALLKAFDLFLLSSIKEGLPYVILEAGCAELPVIASAVGGVPEIITDMHSGILVKPKREDEIALALEYMLANKEKARGFGGALKEKILNEFSFKKTLEATVKLYVNNDNMATVRYNTKN